MDSMDLEREKGITIQSAATRVNWNDTQYNIIDTPGHVDFTIEVERALRVLDGAVMIVCAVGGVQSQTMTVDRQMKRYNVPRLVFINKCDRQGSDPDRCIAQLRSKLSLNVAAIQYPMGLEDFHSGVVDLVHWKAYTFEGARGELMVESEVPEQYREAAEAKRQELIEAIAEIDDEVAEHVIMNEGEPLPEGMLAEAIRRNTVEQRFCPVLMGSAFKNKGVQPLLQAIKEYLPAPDQVKNTGVDLDNDEAEVEISSDPNKPFVGLAFKLEENRFGQLTYVRLYQGTLRKGDPIVNTRTGEKIKTPRLIRMHASDLEDITEAKAGDICAIFGVECNSGDTFTAGENVAMSSMHVPEPVISYAVKPEKSKQATAFAKALARFQREDPTFRVSLDEESNETIISGMGELHLQIYMERMKREYDVDVVSTPPRVAFRETIRNRVEFDHTHKKQTGGSGQFARVVGFLEPLEINQEDRINEFDDQVIGGTIPPEYMPACQKGFEDIVKKGPLTGHGIQWVRMVLNDGASHAVDSSDLAFRTATKNAFRKAFKEARPALLEPVMSVEVMCPAEFQANVIGGLNRRKGTIVETDSTGEWITIQADVSLSRMFGYSTDLRSCTQGKGEFSMEFSRYAPVDADTQKEMEKRYEEESQQKVELF